jgi:hypothetical protein
MSGVRVLAGTRKGAFILTSDEKRQKWDVQGPHFAGWEIYHLKGSPADPDRIYASQTSGWFGQIIQRSDDGGKTWHQPGTPPGESTKGPDGMPKGESNKFVYDTSPETGKPLTTHQHYDGTQKPWEFKRVWHLEPSLSEPDTVYAGDRGRGHLPLHRRRQDLEGAVRAARARHRPQWQPGAGGMCLHTILIDPKNEKRIFVAISSAGAFRSDDGGQTWKADHQGPPFAVHPGPHGRGRPLRPSHRAAPLAPERPLHAEALGRDAQRRRGENWTEVSGNLPTDFGFVIDVHAHEPETVYVVPIKSDSEHYPPTASCASTAAARAGTSGRR